MNQPSFADSLLICDDESSLKMRGGNRFIKKLPDDRSLGYLHKLHGPLSNVEIERICDGIGRRLPAQMESFLCWSNGASLFDNQIYLFGLAESVSRSLAPETQKPISIVDKNRIFSAARHRRWNDGWIHVGSIVGWDANYEIELHESGACAVTFREATYSSASFEQCVESIIDRISICYSCDGIIDHSFGEVDAAVASLFRPN